MTLQSLTSLFDNVLVHKAIIGVLAAWVMGQSIAYVYASHSEQGAKRSFLQALVAGGIVGAMLMLAIGNSLARGVGIVATLSLIRFRTNLRDPLDMIYIFASFAGGIAAGTGNAIPGFLGIGLFLGVMSAMRLASSTKGSRDAELRLRLHPPANAEAAAREAIRLHTVSAALKKRKDVGDKETRLEFDITLQKGDGTALMTALRAVAGITEVAIDLDDGPAEAGGDDD